MAQKGADAIGQVRYENYITEDTLLKRVIVLTAEGYLLIRDTLKPGPSMKGWNAGQLWQLYTMSAHGDHWFCSEDEGAYPNISKDSLASTTRRMLVRFAANAGTTAGYEKLKQDIVDPNPKNRPANSYFTTYSQRMVQWGRPEVFSMVVVPNDPKGLSPEELAKKVAINQMPDGSTEATINTGSNPVTVHVGEKEWTVNR